jgi:aspartyl-tRNA(Asn)/glutamyl-tRNA(Gln) amidotransferase subunit C
MSLTRADVEKIAQLARLELTEAEVALYQGQLSAILDYAERLNELDLAGVPPTAHAVTQQNVWRDDVAEPGMDMEAVLFNAPKQAHNQFVVQAVLDEG